MPPRPFISGVTSRSGFSAARELYFPGRKFVFSQQGRLSKRGECVRVLGKGSLQKEGWVAEELRIKFTVRFATDRS